MNNVPCYLKFTDGTLVDGVTYSTVDEARDVAFDVSLETGLEVDIYLDWPAVMSVLETVSA